MDEEYLFLIYVAIASLVFGTCIGSCVGNYKGERTIKKEAVEAEVAEFYLDEKNEKQFRFLKPEPPMLFPADEYGNEPLPKYNNGNSNNSRSNNTDN